MNFRTIGSVLLDLIRPHEWGHKDSCYLPEELQEKIFGYLDEASQANGLLVCRQWKRILDKKEFLEMRKQASEERKNFLNDYTNSAIDRIRIMLDGKFTRFDCHDVYFTIYLAGTGEICEISEPSEDKAVPRRKLLKREAVTDLMMCIEDLDEIKSEDNKEKKKCFPSKISYQKCVNISSSINKNQTNTLLVFREKLRNELQSKAVWAWGEKFGSKSEKWNEWIKLSKRKYHNQKKI